MNILTLDLGQSMGWAITKNRVVYLSGTENFKPTRYEGGGMCFLRFRKFLNDVLIQLKSCGGLEAIYFEEVRFAMYTDAHEVWSGFLATLTGWCEENKIPYCGIPVGTIKKIATGKGSASKEKVIKAMEAKGHKPKTEDEADAIAIAYTVLEIV